MTNDNDLKKEDSNEKVKHFENKTNDTECKDCKEIKLDIKKEIENLHLEIKQTNKNFEDLIARLDKFDLTTDMKSSSKKSKSLHFKKMSLKKIISHPIRKLTVRTLSSIFAIADKSNRKMMNIKNDFKDIAAEAKYKSQKKELSVVEPM